MKILRNTLLYIGFAIHATAALSESSDESSTNYILLNGQAVAVEADVTRAQHSPEPLEQVIMNMNNYEPSLGSAQIQQNTPFMPLEGIYDKSKVIYEHLCMDPDSPNSTEMVMNIVDVDTENATFIIRWTTPDNPDNPDFPTDSYCKLHGLLYNCETPTQVVNFAILGKDAVVTVEESTYGVWEGEKKHILTTAERITCEGPDCEVEPVSSLYGTLLREMPCSGMSVDEYEWQSALLSQSDASLLIKSVNTKNLEHLDIQNLSTEALVDSDDRFEAILFDFQSQETIASLEWNNNESSGKITFETDNHKDEVILHIANIEDMPSFERYNILLQGLHEAGIAWLSQQSGLQTFKKVDEKPQLTEQVNPMTHGAIDSTSPSRVSTSSYSAKSEEVARYAEGWAYDPDDSSKSIWVHLYGRSNSKSAYRYIGAVFADQERPDVNSALGISGDHGFKVKIPTEWDIDDVHDNP
jgi:hypothetical protein